MRNRASSADGPANGPRGHGWTHNYNMNLAFDGNTTVTVNYGDGAGVAFKTTDGVNFAPTKGVTEKLIKNSNATYKLIFADQTKYNFDSSGTLTSQVDRYGNETTMTYEGGVLTKVTDASGRYLKFDYRQLPGSFAGGTIYRGQPVGSLTGDNSDMLFGNISPLNYSGSSAPVAIKKVTDSASRTISFKYNSAGNILSIKDPPAMLFSTQRHQVDFAYDDRGNQTSLRKEIPNLLLPLPAAAFL